MSSYSSVERIDIARLPGSLRASITRLMCEHEATAAANANAAGGPGGDGLGGGGGSGGGNDGGGRGSGGGGRPILAIKHFSNGKLAWMVNDVSKRAIGAREPFVRAHVSR